MSVILRAAGAHGRERLVARRVDERDRALAQVRLVRADVLRDAAELPRDDVRLADRVQELGLAVVDVAHDGHDRRARDQRGLVDLLFGLGVELFLDPDDLRVVPRSAAISSIASSESDVVAVTISPAMNRIFTMSAGDLPDLLRDRLGRRAADELHHGQGGLRRRDRDCRGFGRHRGGSREVRGRRRARRRPAPPPSGCPEPPSRRASPPASWACGEPGAARAPRGAWTWRRSPCRRWRGAAGSGPRARSRRPTVRSPPSVRGSPRGPCS